MPSTTADVLVRFLGESSKLQKSMSEASGATVKASQRIKGALVGAGAAIAGAFAAQAVVGFIGDTIKAASDLHETVSKTQQVFGPAGAAVVDWSKTTADSMGQSQQQALDAAATFGIFGKAAGLTGDSLAGFSTDLTGLASDMASFSNTTPQEAIEALGAGLRGESEPLRKYGVLLDEATLRAAAMAMGIVKTTKQALTPQQRVLAAQKVIMDQTKDAQGDFARTSGGLANQQRILSARMANLKVTIGSALLPVVLTLVTVMGTAIGIFASFAQWIGKNADVLGPIAIAIVVLTVALNASAIATGIASAATAIYSTVLLNARIAMMLFNAAIAANPIGAIVILLVGLAVLFFVLYKRVGWFRAAVDTAFRALVSAAQWLVGAFMSTFRVLATVLKIAFIAIAALILLPILPLILLGAYLVGLYKKSETFRAIVQGAFNAVAATVRVVASVIMAVFRAALAAVTAYVRAWINVNLAILRAMVGAVRGALSGISGAITAGFRAALGVVRRIASSMTSAFSGVAGAISRALSGVFGAIIGPFQSAWNWIRSNVIGPIKSGWNTIANALNAVSFTYTVPSNVITKALHIAGKGFTISLPHIPTLARGAYLTSPTAAIVGEAGPEFVLPEAALRKAIREELGGTTIIVNGALDPDAVARQIESLLARRARRVGGPVRRGIRATA